MFAKGMQRASVRFQSTGKDSSSLLDIFKRIDLITSKTATAVSKNAANTSKTPRTKPSFTNRPSGTQVQVANHPLRNSLGQNKFEGRTGQNRFEGRPGQNRSEGRPGQNRFEGKPGKNSSEVKTQDSASGAESNETAKPDASRQFKAQPRTSQNIQQIPRPRVPRTPRAQGTPAQGTTAASAQGSAPSQGQQTQAPRSGKPIRRNTSRESDEKVARAPSRKLEAAHSLGYQVNGDTFLYGKIASVNPCVTSRVASITKEALVNSKYPYLVPRSIIEQLPESSEINNKFLLQKNFSLDVDASNLQNRYETVVLGKHEEVSFDNKGKGKDAIKEADFTKLEIQKNGSLGIAQRQFLFDAVNGVKSPKDLIAGACWLKK